MLIHEDLRYQKLIERIEALHFDGSTDNIQPLLNELQTLAEAEQDDIGLAAAYFYRDILSDKKPGSDSYMQFAKRSLKIAEAKNIPYYQMKASNSLGIMYSELSDFHSSLEHYQHAIQIAEEHPEYLYLSILLNNVGNLFVWLEDYTEAANYLARAYDKCIVENSSDRQLIAVIIINLFELYSNLENDKKAQEWKEKTPGTFNDEEKAIIACISLNNEARHLLKRGRTNDAADKIRTFIKRSLDISDYTYIFHCHNTALKMGLRLKDFPLCSSLMDRMDFIQRNATITSFSYNYAKARSEYYFAFKDRLGPHCHTYYDDYYRESQNRIKQLCNTYARSLSVKIALEEIKDENKNVHLQNKQLQKDIERDVFTNLYNKVSTEKHVREAMKKRQAGKKQGFLLIDIDLFKRINDNYGHSFGDIVITSVAKILESLDKPHMIAGRFGGDEFLVFLDLQNSTTEIKKAANTLLAQVRNSILLPDDLVKEVTLSIGICVIDSPIEFEQAFALADKALYRAKELGRNRYELSAI